MKDADAGAAQCKHFWWNATGLQKTDAVKDADADQCKLTFKVRLHWSASASFTASASFMKKRMEADAM